MAVKFLLWFLATFVGCTHGQPDPGGNPCGLDDWILYNNESCLIIPDNVDMRLTKQDAEILCSKQKNDMYDESPKLVMIKSQEKQNYIYDLLIRESFPFNIWLGLEKSKKGVYKWNDGTTLNFSHWSPMRNDPRYDNLSCVEMEPKDEGYWYPSYCQSMMLSVICEKSLTPPPRLPDVVLNFKLELEKQQSQAKRELEAIKEDLRKISALHQESNNRNGSLDLVPIGFVYLQLPFQTGPRKIWPQATWADVSQLYAGNFLRVVGGGSKVFGQEQESTAPRLEQVESVKDADNKWMSSSVPSNGNWSEPVSMGWRASGDNWRGMRFRMSTDEVRPKNQAIKVWQRVK